MFIITVDTRNFEFVGLGNTEEQAKQALLKEYQSHCKCYPDAQSTLMQEYLDEESYRMIELEPGQATSA